MMRLVRTSLVVAFVVLLSAGPLQPAARGQAVSLLSSTGLSTAQFDLAISPDGRFAVVRAGAGGDGVTFYRLSDGAEIGRFSMATAPSSGIIVAARSLAVSPDGEWVIATGGAGADAVAIFDTRGESPSLAGRFPLLTSAHDVAISPDGRFGVVRSGASFGPSPDGVTFYRFDRAAGTAQRVAERLTFTSPPGVRSVAISPGGERTVVLGGAGASAILVFNTAGPTPSLMREHQLLTAAHDLAISPDGRFAVVRSGAALNGIVFIRLSTGELLAAPGFGTQSAPPYPPDGVMTSTSVEVSPNGERAVVLGGAAPDSVVIFDTSGALPQELSRTGLATLPHDVAITPDDRFAVVRAGAGADGIAVFDLSDGSLLRTFATFSAPANDVALGTTADSVAVGPDGGRVVAIGGAGAGAMTILDSGGAEPVILAQSGLSTAARDVAVAPDGTYVVVRASQGVVFHRLADGGLLGEFSGLTAPAPIASEAVAIAPDGRRVVTIGGAGSVDVFAVRPALGPFAEIERVSVASDGSEADFGSNRGAISADGRYVAFDSVSTNLVPGTNPGNDVFVHDRTTGITDLVSVASDGTSGDALSTWPALSADGRYVAFESSATNLVPGDTNEATDIFVHDRATGITERVSVASDGTQADAAFSAMPAISADGRYVAFLSEAKNLVPGTELAGAQLFVHDRRTGMTKLASRGPDGTPANGLTVPGALSADGRYVVFSSFANNMINILPADPAPRVNVFVHDRATGLNELVTVASDGDPAKAVGGSFPAISADGRYVTFTSCADDLVAGEVDTPCGTFVRDRKVGITERVSVASDGTPAEVVDGETAISPEGRWVAFASRATNLVPGVDNGIRHIYVHDRQTSRTWPVSVSFSGELGNGLSSTPSLTLDAGFVAFASFADNLVSGDNNERLDAFVTTRVPPPSAEFLQPNLAVLPNIVDARQVRVESSPGTELRDVRSVGYPSFDGAPTDVDFPAAFLDFEVTGVGADGATVDILLPPGVNPTTYWKFGPTPDNPTPHWYEFLFDSSTGTGAVILENRVTLHFVDGQRGDDDLAADGIIRDAGGPGIPAPAEPPSECVPGATTLCLNGGRFAVEVDWVAPQGTSGPGRAEPLTDDTGTFWFFDPDNVEVVIKVLDACVPFDRFWVFAAGLTDVAVDITVTDTAAGVARTFHNPQGVPFQPIQATGAFATCGAGSSAAQARSPAASPAASRARRQHLSSAPLRLNDDRFEIHVTWQTPLGTSGSGQPEALTGDTGTFWFFHPDNVEVVIKVLDACVPFDRFWVFAAGLTDVEVEITVFDTATDAVRTYENPQGVPFQPLQDTGAFATCP